MSNPIFTIILAAGASTRMEGDIKQLLPWGKTTLLEHALAQASQISEHQIAVLGAKGHLISETLSLGNKAIQNEKWKTGMGSSIVSGVEFVLNAGVNPSGILIMLADQPLLDASFLAKLKSKFNGNAHKIVATKYGEKLGVPAIFHSSIFPELIELSQEFGAREIIRKYKKQSVGIDPEGMEIDIDTKATYAELIQKIKF